MNGFEIKRHGSAHLKKIFRFDYSRRTIPGTHRVGLTELLTNSARTLAPFTRRFASPILAAHWISEKKVFTNLPCKDEVIGAKTENFFEK